MRNLLKEPELEIQKPRWDALCLVFGALLVLAFAPFRIFPLAIISMLFLFLVWYYSTPRRAAWRGLLFGIGMFGAGVSWVFISISQFGNMTTPLAVTTVILFVLILSLYPALAGWLQARFFGNKPAIRFLLVLPALWVMAEWLRGWFLSGFPWLNLGYSQTPGPLVNWAAWWGVYGVSFFTALTASMLAWLMVQRRLNIAIAIATILAIWLGAYGVGLITWTQAEGSRVKIGLVQGNIPIRKKWNSDKRDVIFQDYLKLSKQLRQADIIAWPEAALSYDIKELKPYQLSQLRNESKRYKTEFLIGFVQKEYFSGKWYYFNSATALGESTQIYQKQHLVPFGEYVPLRFIFDWIMRSIHIPMSDFNRGAKDQKPLKMAGQEFGISICYEDAFGEELIRGLPRAKILINLSEDAWFGRSLAPHQRLQMAQIRAIESGRDMVRVGNTGVSALIDYRGNVKRIAPQYQVHVLMVEAQPRQGLTLYARLGNWPIVLFSGFLLLLALLLSQKTTKP